MIDNDAWVARSKASSLFWAVNGANLRPPKHIKAFLAHSQSVSHGEFSTIHVEQPTVSLSSRPKDILGQESTFHLLSGATVQSEVPIPTASSAVLPPKASDLDASKLPDFRRGPKNREHIHSVYCGHRHSDHGEPATILKSDRVRGTGRMGKKPQDKNAQVHAADSRHRGSESKGLSISHGRVGPCQSNLPSNSRSSVSMLSIGQKSLRHGKIRLVTEDTLPPSSLHISYVSERRL